MKGCRIRTLPLVWLPLAKGLQVRLVVRVEGRVTLLALVVLLERELEDCRQVLASQALVCRPLWSACLWCMVESRETRRTLEHAACSNSSLVLVSLLTSRLVQIGKVEKESPLD